MTTKAPPMLFDTAHKWEDLLPSAVFAGIVGDTNHPDGYHISYEDNPANNYSRTRPPDKPPKMPSANVEMASAIDMSMNKTDMVKSYKRIKAVYDDKTDPRRKYFNAVNCWSGSGDAVRLDLYANVISVATADHKSHVHDEYPRMYCQYATAGRAHLSVWSGQTKAQWIAQEEGDVNRIICEQGDTGEWVKACRQLLNRLGYSNDTANGTYDAALTVLVKKYRTDHLKPELVGTGRAVTGWMFTEMLWELSIKAAKANPGPKGDKGDPGTPGAPGPKGEDGVPASGQEFTVKVV